MSELLLEKGYEVFGLARKETWEQRGSASNLSKKINCVYGDITKEDDVRSAVKSITPDEIYNLASLSDPGSSWRRPADFLLANGTSVLFLLDAVRSESPKTRIYQASSSEMYGDTSANSQNEETPFNPVNPYAAAKVYAHLMARIYRQTYGLYVATGIMFNHESERRPLRFLTQKVAYGAACTALGIDCSPDLNEQGRPIVEAGRLTLGNMTVARDWGYAPDFVRGMWLILQQEIPQDFVIGTGKLHTVQELCEIAYSHVGHDWKKNVRSSQELFRPVESTVSRCDSAKAKKLLGWEPLVSFEEMVIRMVETQIQKLSSF